MSQAITARLLLSGGVASLAMSWQSSPSSLMGSHCMPASTGASKGPTASPVESKYGSNIIKKGIKY